MKMRFQASTSPHIRQPQTVRSIMLDVCIALLPAVIYGVIRFGVHAALVVLASVAAAVATEALVEVLSKKKLTINDCSAMVTGMLVAMGCPPGVPLWLPMIGSFFAIAIVKMLFGGLGQNFMNPALTARAVLLASWPVLMTTWEFPAGIEAVSMATSAADTVSLATPLVSGAGSVSYWGLLIGNVGGCIGETSKLLLLLGGIYLIVRKVIRPHTPIATLVTLFLLTWAFGGENGIFTGDGLYAILSGGIVLGAFFMATDYVTSPVTATGQIIMGIGVGGLVFVIRTFGSYPEGVTYAILFMNLVSPLIDRFIRPRIYGEVKAA